MIGLTRVVTKHARPPSEAGRINVVVYSHSGAGNGLPPPKKSMEQLELPVSMEGTFCKLCVRCVPMWPSGVFTV